MLKSVVLDDDELSRALLKNLIEKTNNIELIAEYSNPKEALKELESLNCDVIFLDIEMPEMNGLEFIEKSKNIPQVVITSSKSEYASEAFNYDVTDYLVKPFTKERFDKSIERINEINETVTENNPNESYMFFKKNNSLIRVDFDEINYIEAYSDYVVIYTNFEKFVVLSTMKAIEQRFPSNDFMRVHRSYIVRLDKIKSIEDNSICLAEKTIPVSRSCKPEFIKKMNIF